MATKAPRLPQRLWRRLARGAWTASALVTISAGAALACTTPPWTAADVAPGSVVTSAAGDTAWYSGLSDAYGHAVLGDALEPTRLHLFRDKTATPCGTSAAAGANHVFEDIAPRFADVDGDGHDDLIAVRSHFQKGAQLVVYTAREARLTPLAMTPYIGTRNRWLAPAGAADFDGDGNVEVAFVDRPHLAKTLRIWRFASDGDFREIATMRGVTNHRIGEDFITGGSRDCGDGPEMVLVDAGWQNILTVRYDDDSFVARAIAPFRGQDSVVRVMGCS
ncbi:MAG: FG-GAP repeat domain-containing protein [Arenibacterium sp.]